MLIPQELRTEIANISQEIYRSGLTCSTGGNISVRYGDIFLISKTETSFSRLKPTDVIACDLAGNPLEEGRPSKEVGFHAVVYQQREDIGAIVHVHSPYAVALGAFPLNESNTLPACTYGAITKVGKAPLVEFLTPGQPDLFNRVSEVIPNADNAIYLAKHGVIAFAKNLEKAWDVAEEFEQNAKIYVLSAGKVPLLTAAEIECLRKKEGKK